MPVAPAMSMKDLMVRNLFEIEANNLLERSMLDPDPIGD